LVYKEEADWVKNDEKISSEIIKEEDEDEDSDEE